MLLSPWGYPFESALLSIACKNHSPSEVIVYPGRSRYCLQVGFTPIFYMPSIIICFWPHVLIGFYFPRGCLFWTSVGFLYLGIQPVYLWASFHSAGYFLAQSMCSHECIVDICLGSKGRVQMSVFPSTSPLSFLHHFKPWTVRPSFKWRCVFMGCRRGV